MRKYLFFVIVVLIGASFYFAYKLNESNSNDFNEVVLDSESGNKQFDNSTFGYQLSYSEGKTLMEYSPVVASIGSGEGEEFSPEIDIQVATSNADDGYADYQNFLYKFTSNYCAADGPDESIYCTDVVSSDSFTSTSGVSGEIFYLKRIHHYFVTGEEQEGVYGPIYAFNLSANVPESLYAALLIRPSAALLVEQISESDLRLVAESVNINKVERKQSITNLPETGSFTLKVGNSVSFDDTKIEFKSVVSDSRCPDGVQCIQAGSVLVELSVMSEGIESIEKIDSNSPGVILAGKKIKIESVTPVPVAGTKVKDKDYEVTFVLN